MYDYSRHALWHRPIFRSKLSPHQVFARLYYSSFCWKIPKYLIKFTKYRFAIQGTHCDGRVRRRLRTFSAVVILVEWLDREHQPYYGIEMAVSGWPDKRESCVLSTNPYKVPAGYLVYSVVDFPKLLCRVKFQEMALSWFSGSPK